MKTVTDVAFMTAVLITLFTTPHENFVSAPLVEIYENCAENINNIFTNCEGGCETYKEKIKFIFLHVCMDDYAGYEYEIEREYVGYLYKMIFKTTKKIQFECPTTYCLNYFFPSSCRNAFTNLNFDLSNHDLALARIFHYFTIDQNLEVYIKQYVEHVQKSVIIPTSHKVLDIPEKFCEMQKCEYEIRIDMPDININDADPFYYVKIIMFKVVYAALKNDSSKGYVDFFYHAISKTSIKKLITVEYYCANHYVYSKKMCYSFLEELNLSLTNNEANLKQIFYHYSQNNTYDRSHKYVEIDDLQKYVELVFKELELDAGKLRSISSPEEYCTHLVRKNK